MFSFRSLILAIGPLAIIAISYSISVSRTDPQQVAFSARVAESEERAHAARARQHLALTEACTQTATLLQPRLPDKCRVVVRAPFVVAGDFDEDNLDRLYREALLPVSNALWRAYFDRRPDQPIVIVALSREQTYQAAARKLDKYEPKSYAGYFQRSERRIVLDLSTGYGTLAHELAHALAEFDFPGMPEWFDEGLASLHEETEFSEDGLLLIGLPNWRFRLLPEAIRSDTLPSLESLITAQSFRGEGEGLNYAQVRGFCQFLQDRDLLSHFYRKFRENVERDPSGQRTLCEVLGLKTLQQVDDEFRKWVLRQDQSAAKQTASQPAATKKHPTGQRK